jgi:hypothetical protein
MIISEKNAYVYFDNPKTGTVSTEKYLLKVDDSTCKRVFNVEGKKFWFADHTPVKEVKSKLGNDFDKYSTFSIIRHPTSKLVSSYFFYKNGKPITKGNKNPLPTKLRVLFARLVPLWLWAIIYPYRSNLYHLTDEDGNILVDYIGFFENISENIIDLSNLIIPERKQDISFPHSNKSTHKPVDSYLSNSIFGKIIRFKLRKDILFYESLWNEGRIYKIKE